MFLSVVKSLIDFIDVKGLNLSVSKQIREYILGVTDVNNSSLFNLNSYVPCSQPYLSVSFSYLFWKLWGRWWTKESCKVTYLRWLKLIHAIYFIILKSWNPITFCTPIHCPLLHFEYWTLTSNDRVRLELGTSKSEGKAKGNLNNTKLLMLPRFNHFKIRNHFVLLI